jgi:FKBP-type peptidyl-prolyl cis-trans isomerase
VKAVAQDGYADAAKVRKAIKHGVSSGALQPSAGSAAKFWVGGEPVPAEPTGPTVQVEVIAEGDGAPVEPGDTVAINYELFLADTGQRVEAGKRFTFQVGAGDVIQGMDAGVLGLRLGGKSKVTVPWALGYGKRGSPPAVPPCADLIFKICLASITRD